MTDTDHESILDKVSKLMAKAKKTDNEHEAAIFAAKAAEMLAKHNLDEAQLKGYESSLEEGPIGSHAYEGRIADRWRELIAMGCAKLYFCELTKAHGSREYTFHGREHNAKVAMLMLEYLIATVKRMGREYSSVRREQADFRKGAGVRLYERLNELYNASVKPAPTSAQIAGTTLPALYQQEEDAVKAYLSKAIPNLRSGGKARGMKMGLGAAAGRQAANKISLNKQVDRKARAALR